MKKIFVYALAGVLTLSSLAVSCTKEDKGPAPTNIEASSLATESQEGKVKISWAIPNKANYKYIKVTYVHPDTKKEHVRLASVYADHIIIDGLLGRHGEITFKLVPVTATGVEGKTEAVTASAKPLPKVTQIVPDTASELKLDATKMWTDSNQPGDGGGLPAIIDNNPNTFWHMTWNGGQPFPHYLVIELPEPVSSLSTYWRGRLHPNRNNPRDMEVWVSNEPFDGTSYAAYASDAKSVKVATYTAMPDGQGAEYTSNAILLPAKYKYVCYKITAGHNSPKFSALSEWKVFKHKLSVYDPETNETTEL